MAVTVIIPGSLKDWFDGADEVICEPDTLGKCLEDLAARYPVFASKLYDAHGNISSLLIFINGDNAARGRWLATPLADGDEVGIIPLAAGG
ncbi:MAG: MoaD/ThiS family protein [Desulfatibacillaceae bacterium]|nr:MoaD/ThiS family protein [Desulfatibacillaceae bacterium]